MSHIYENPVEIELHQLARISSVCVNIPKFASSYRPALARLLLTLSWGISSGCHHAPTP